MSPGSNLRQYLPRLVRFWDAEAPGRLHRSIEGSMVFVDISGFTKMSERLARHGNVGAEEVTEVIDNTFGTLLPEAYGYGANLLKFGGDALLLMFTDPGHAERAAAGAYAMRAKLREIGTFQTTAGKVSLRMSVGLHAGDFDFFLVGDSHREFVVAGPAATRTVEMEGAANANQILLSPELAARLDRRLLGDASGPGVLLRRGPEVEPSEIVPDSGPADHLRQFIPLALREVLGEQRVEPEHRPTAVAFLHYEGFDHLLAERGGGEVGEILHRLVSAVQAAADEHDVTFLATDIAPDGGKIILTAGVPHTRGNDEERMLLTLRKVLATAPPELPLQIGVNWGPIFSGSVGPFYRRTFTVMGDVVNLAARLMSKAPEGEIYATEEVLNASRTLFSFTKPEPFFVKGKAAAIQAYSVGDPSGSRDGSSGPDLPLIGRHAELATLVGAWEAACRSEGRVIEIAAEVGMGKSRLLQEFFARANSPRIVATECRLYQAATPYFPFRALLRNVWDLNDPDDEVNRERLAKLIATEAPHLEAWAGLLAAPLDLDIEASPEVAQLEDQFRPARTLATVAALLEATVREPTVYVIEDNHWMDDASSELLAGLIPHAEDDPWMFVLTRRPGEQGFVAAGIEGVTRLDLGPLTIDDAHRFIVDATADAPLLPRQVDLLAERAEGRPLFLLEMLDAVRRGGDVESLPHSVEGLIGARIDRLPPRDRNLLRRLAVLGAGFRLEYTAAVLREGEQERRRAALRRLDEFLSTDRSGWIQFRNALIRDVAYEGLPFRTRLELHARIGDSIFGAAGDDPDSEAALLSLHYFQARQWAKAWRYSRVAGDDARSVYANQTAATFYRRALTSARYLDLDRPARVEVAQALGDVLEQAGLYDDALDAYKRAVALVGDDQPKRAELLLRRAQVKIRKAEYAQALRDAATGLRILDEGDPTCSIGLRSRLLALRSTVRMAQQRPLDALLLAQDAVECARTSDEHAALARAYAIMDWAYFVTGQADKATNSPEAVEIYESLGQLDKAADVLNNMGGFAFYMGEWNESIQWISKSREMSTRAGNDVQAAMTGVNLGELLVSQRKLDDAEPILRDSLRVLQAAGDQDNAVNAELQLARLLAERGDAAAARELLELVRRQAQQLGQTQFAYEAALYLAECQIRDGAPSEALEQITSASARAGEEAEFFEPKRARISALALLKMARLEEAAEQLAGGLAAAEDLGLLYDEALLRLVRHETNRRRGVGEDLENTEIANRLLDRLGIEQAAALL